MALTKRDNNQTIYLQAKHYCLWRELKKQESGCEEIEVMNPKTGVKIKKYGYSANTVSGYATKLVKYDTEKLYSTRYFGFKLTLTDNGENYVLDMPYQSQILRRFLRVAKNLDFALPLSITVFKGKSKNGKPGTEETGIWFQQDEQTVKPYYSREHPHGMPEAIYDDVEKKFDFKIQHRWLVDRLQAETIPEIESYKVAPPVEPETHEPPLEDEGPPTEWGKDGIADDDVPF